jgi:phosphoribosylformylglycinamidine synthase
MILFFQSTSGNLIAVSAKNNVSEQDVEKLIWLFGEAQKLNSETIEGWFVGPRKEMLTPWSTNAVEITQNMGIAGIERIEEYVRVANSNAGYDPMLQHLYNNLDQTIFTVLRNEPEPIINIDNIAAYNEKEGLALSPDEITYLESVAKELGRPLTDSEVFGFSQVNSEHCRHKIFNGTLLSTAKKRRFRCSSLLKKHRQLIRIKLFRHIKTTVHLLKALWLNNLHPKRRTNPTFSK